MTLVGSDKISAQTCLLNGAHDQNSSRTIRVANHHHVCAFLPRMAQKESSIEWSHLRLVRRRRHVLGTGHRPPKRNVGLWLGIGVVLYCGQFYHKRFAHFSGSLATAHRSSVGKNRKRLLEQPAHISGAGYRTAAQVLENTLSALISCLLYDWFVVSDQHDFGRPDICPVDLNIGRSLLFITLGHYGCCLGDTFASELGILTPGGPWLITTGKKVQRGVNGAVSLGGTLASAVGGASVGLVMALGMGCGYGEFLAWGATAGLVGSVVDSVLGATMQETRVDEKGIVVNDHSGKVIHGRDTLSNGQVNLLSGLATACLIGWLAP